MVMAEELGLFAKHGLEVELSREVGWATIRDKVIYGELDAAHALAPMVFAATLGLGSAQSDCLTGLVLSLGGNGITVAKKLWNAVDSRLEIRRSEPLVFGIPFLHSAHHFLLRSWLRSQRVSSERVRLVVVPPPQMPANLKGDNLDGYCAGEPWNLMAVAAGFGTIAATSEKIAPEHPEKILMTRREFAESRAEEHERLILALLEACQFCAAPENRDYIVATLAGPQYLNLSETTLRDGLAQWQVCKKTFTPDAHEPSHDKAAWVLEQMNESGLLPDRAVFRSAAVARIFRADIFQNAIRPIKSHETTPSFAQVS